MSFKYNVECKLWSTVKDMTNSNNNIPPRSISHNNEYITSLKQIANIANEFYISKIVTIREKFTKSITTPINILEKIIKKPTSIFKLPLITLEETKKLIKSMKSSNSIGHDKTSIKIYKK